VSSRSEGDRIPNIVGCGGRGVGTWVVHLRQIRVAVQDRQHCCALLYVLLWVMKHSPLLICSFFVASASLALDVSARVGPFAHMQNSAPNAKPHVVQKRANGKVQVAYFSNWYMLCCPEGLHLGY
jgi:hypothetical protein